MRTGHLKVDNIFHNNKRNDQAQGKLSIGFYMFNKFFEYIMNMIIFQLMPITARNLLISALRILVILIAKTLQILEIIA